MSSSSGISEGLRVCSPGSAEASWQKKASGCNPNYYFQDDPMSIFLVEDQLFKVHRHFLLEGSGVFRDMFNCPVESGAVPDGMSKEQPIHLAGVTIKEFETLLDYFYKPFVPALTKLVLEHTQEKRLELFLNLLSISHRFLFDEIFRYAVEELRPEISCIPITQKFQLGEKYGLQEWVSSAYKTLVERPAAPTMSEVEVLGFERVVQYIQDREAMHLRRLGEKEAELEKAKKQVAQYAGTRPPTAPALRPQANLFFS